MTLWTLIESELDSAAGQLSTFPKGKSLFIFVFSIPVNKRLVSSLYWKTKTVTQRHFPGTKECGRAGGPSPSAGCVAIGVIPYPGLLGKLRALHAWNSKAQIKHLHIYIYIYTIHMYTHTHTYEEFCIHTCPYGTCYYWDCKSCCLCFVGFSEWNLFLMSQVMIEAKAIFTYLFLYICTIYLHL